MDSLNLVTCEHTITDKERLFYQSNKQISLMNSVEVQSVLPIEKGQGTFKNFLSPSNPVKSFHWFFRNVDFEDATTSTNFLKRFNFSSNVLSSNIYQENSNVIMADAKIFLGGDQQIGFQGNSQTNNQTSNAHIVNT